LKKNVSIVILFVILGSMFSILSIGGEISNTVFFSSTSLQWTQDYDVSGDSPVPNEIASWTGSISAWRHPTWKRVENINSLYSSGADWIWRVEKVTLDEAKTGSVVFFMAEIFIPLDKRIVDASLEMTVDNAFYLYLASQEDGDTGPVWSGEPLILDGFAEGKTPVNFWMVDENNMLLPEPGAIDIDSSVVRTLEPGDDSTVIIDNLKPGLNWLSIVAINAQPEPKSKHVSSNTAGLIYRLDVTYESVQTIPDSIPSDVGFTVPMIEPPPLDFDYTFIDYKPTPIQAVFDPDIDTDTIPDMVLNKPMAVLVKVPDATASTTAEITFDGQIYAETSRYDEGSYDILEFYPIIPQNTGLLTISCIFINDPHSTGPTSTQVEVKETQALELSYHYLDNRKYGSLIEDDFNEFVDQSSSFLNATYPIGTLTVDETYTSISGAGKGNKGDPFKGIRADAIKAAQAAQLAMSSSARGVAVGPTGYFAYHGDAYGFGEAAAISFGPGLPGVVVEDGYWPAVAHEVAHTFSLNWVTAEEYVSDPPFGTAWSGVWVDRGEWTTGICFMGATPYKDLEDSWVHLQTYEELFQAMKLVGDPPDLLLVNGIIYDDSVEFTQSWVRIGDGFPDITDGVYRLLYLDGAGNTLQEVSFDADYTVEYHPKMGAEVLGFVTSYSPFAFVAPYDYPDTTALIEIYDYTVPEDPVYLGFYDPTNIMYFDRWLTDSGFNDLDELVLNFQKDNGDPSTYSLVSTNPDTIIFNVVVEDLDFMSLLINLTDVTGPGGIVNQAFTLAGVDPIHVYSQDEANPAYDVSGDAIIDTSTEGIIQVDYSIPPGELAYVTILLEPASKGTSGWTEEEVQGYDELPFFTSIKDALGNFTAVENVPTILMTRVNMAPVVDAGLDDAIDEGGTFTGSGSFTDPGDDTWTATVNYGDGSGVQPDILSESYIR
jgi:hypothetical protein